MRACRSCHGAADNCRANAHAWSGRDARDAPATRALSWGAPPPAEAPFDLVVGTDLFYAREAMGLLVETLVALSGPRTTVWLAAGRNRQAADEFWPRAEERFTVEAVPLAELDPLYNLEAVGVWRLRLRPRRTFETPSCPASRRDVLTAALRARKYM